MERRILHVDQNCYFASVEMIYHPECRDVPMAVVGDAEKRHGIVLAKNQLASKAGVKTAEAIWEAETKCPNLVKLSAHYDKYMYYSQKLREMYMEYTDKVEPFGLDECWLDITNSCLDKSAEDIANEIRERVKNEFNLTCSVGVSFNKIFAKLGSDYKKPDAVTVIDKDNYKDIVWKLPASDLLFIGKHTNDKLAKINIRTIGDIARADRNYLIEYLGKAGDQIWTNANGFDESEVASTDHKREIKSVGNSTTTPSDMTNVREVAGTLRQLSASVASRLRNHKMIGSCIQITVRDKYLHIYDHQRNLYEATNNEAVIYKAAMDLFEESYDWSAPIRSIGVRCTKLVPETNGIQMSIFTNVEQVKKDDKLARVMDTINERYGKGSIRSAAELQSTLSKHYDGSRSDGGICGGGPTNELL